MPEPRADNLHAVGIVIGRRGLLITGESGSGKTALALALLSHCSAHGCFARLVADDQLLLRRSGGRLVASAPPPIAGLAEARGWRPARLPYLSAMIVDFAVALDEPSAVTRYADDRRCKIAGVELPQLLLSARDVVSAVHAIAARCAVFPFDAAADVGQSAAN